MLDRAPGDVEACDRDAEHDERDRRQERGVRPDEPHEHRLEHRARDRRQDHPSRLQRERRRHGQEREVEHTQRARREIGVPQQLGQLQEEHGRHVEDRDVDADEARDPIRAPARPEDERGRHPVGEE